MKKKSPIGTQLFAAKKNDEELLKEAVDFIKDTNKFATKQPWHHVVMYFFYRNYIYILGIIIAMAFGIAFIPYMHSLCSSFLVNTWKEKLLPMYLIAPLGLLVFNALKSILDDLISSSNSLIDSDGPVESLFLSERNINEWIESKLQETSVLSQDDFNNTASTILNATTSIKQTKFFFIAITSLFIAFGTLLTILDFYFTSMLSVILLIAVYSNMIFLSSMTIYNSRLIQSYYKYIASIENLNTFYDEYMLNDADRTAQYFDGKPIPS